MSDATTVTVVETPSPSVEQPSSAETVAAIEAQAGAATEVAVIEANRDVAIAEISADVQREAIVASTEVELARAISREEFDQCQQSLGALSSRVETMATELQSIQTLLTERLPPKSPELDANVETPDNHADPAPEQPPRKRKSHRWI